MVFQDKKPAVWDFEIFDDFIEIIGGDVDFSVFDIPKVLPIDIEFFGKCCGGNAFCETMVFNGFADDLTHHKDQFYVEFKNVYNNICKLIGTTFF